MKIALFVLLIALSGFFSGAEIAFFSLTKAQVRALRDQKKRYSDLVWRLKQKPQRLLITILIGNNIVNVLTASLATVVAVDYFGSVGVGLATGVVTLVILIFGEITPKSIAQKNNALLARATSPVLLVLSWLFFPVSWLLIQFNERIAHRLVKTSELPLPVEDEIRVMARMGVESGTLQYREHKMIENILEFDEKKVGEIMTSRYKIIALNGEVPVDQISHFVGQSGFSRYPVFVDDEDNFIGYVHVNDILRKLQSDERDQMVKEFVRPLQRVGEDKIIESIFRQFLNAQEHIAIVERGVVDGTEVVGLVTLEDVLEEIVGEIVDETDDEEEKDKL
ncbi:MAG: hemolysin family protein [Patescibacteria group bacterium]